MFKSFGIKVYKQYFNFASSHFMLFADGTREPLHGHNYRVMFRGDIEEKLINDMVIDFLDIKPIIRNICNKLDHKLLIPKNNSHIKIKTNDNNYEMHTSDGSFFSIPAKDVLLLEIENTSVERIAEYLSNEIMILLKDKFKFEFKNIEVEVEETTGQSATYSLRKE